VEGVSAPGGEVRRGIEASGMASVLYGIQIDVRHKFGVLSASACMAPGLTSWLSSLAWLSSFWSCQVVQGAWDVGCKGSWQVRAGVQCSRQRLQQPACSMTACGGHDTAGQPFQDALGKQCCRA